MRHSVPTQRAALRAKFLFGAAAAAVSGPALANQAATAPPDDSSKWSPYSSIGGSAGSGMVGGKLDLFVPLFQNMDSLVFLDLGVGTETKAHTLYNVGGGYRREIDADWIVGAYVSHDGTQLQDNNTFGQTTLGAELMSADWDVRLNGYIAANEAKPVPGEFSLYINGTTIAVLQSQDVGYSGFDGEIGYRVFANDNTDIRVFIGGFHFMRGDTNATSTGEHFDFSYRDITGPKARAEATVYDLDVLGNQSRLTLDGEIAHDDVRGTTGFVGVTLRVALGNFSGGSGAQALSELDRRMVDPERRNDTVLTRSEFTRPEPVVIYGSGVKSQPTNTLLYVDNTPGVGTYANPTTFADATARPTTNAFIVLTSKQGPITGGGTLQPGQTVVAGGETFSVQGVYSHATFSHLFDPSTNVTLMPSSPGANVITLAPNTTIHGFNIVGDFGSAIYGKNVHDVSIDNVAIDGTGGGVNGIDIVRTVSGDQNIKITNTSIANVTGVGIRLDTNVTDGGTSALNAALNNVRISRTGGDGIDISTYAGGGSKITNGVSISNSLVAGAGANDIDVSLEAHGTGTSVDQVLIAESDNVTGAKEDGIFLSTYADGGAVVTSNASLSDLTIPGAKRDGIDVVTKGVGGGSSIDQTLSLSNLSATISGGENIFLDSYAGAGGHVVSNETLANVTLGNAAFGAFSSYADAYGAGSSLSRTLSISNAAATKAGGHAFYLFTRARAGAQLTDAISLAHIDVSGAKYYGIDVPVTVEGAGSKVTQTLAFSDLVISGAGRDGVTIVGSNTGGTLKQDISISNAVISDIGSHVPAAYGIRIATFADGGGSYSYESASITNTTIFNVSANYASFGIALRAGADNAGAVIQTDTIQSVSGANSATGLYVAALAFDNGSGPTTVDQHVTVTNSSFSGNTFAGINVQSEAGTNSSGYHSQAALAQDLTITDTAMDGNGVGLRVYEYIRDGASGTQNVTLYNVDASHNLSVGVLGYARAGALGFAGQNIVFNDKAGSYNTIAYNGGFGNGPGILLRSTASAAGEINQHLYVYATHVDHNAGDGVTVNNATGGYLVGQQVYYTHLQQNMIFAYGSVAHNGRNGVTIANTVTYAAQTDQIIQIYKEKLDQNGQDGFNETSTVTTFQGLGYTVPTNLHSDLYFTQSDASHNGGSGIVITAKLNSPTYIPKNVAYSYLEQHITVQDSTVEHNAKSGFVNAAYDQGVFGINIQYVGLETAVSMKGSSFSYNGGDGADFIGRQFFGPGAFGATVQDVTIAGSNFSHNAGSGLYAYAYAGGFQGRDEQHFTLEPLALSATETLQNHFDYNHGSGIDLKRVAENGVYVSGHPCTAAQGLTGGCAFVRQTFAMIGGSADNNHGDGVYVSNSAENFGAIYDVSGRPHSPEFYFNGVDLSSNKLNGFLSQTTADKNSYAAQYVVAVDTLFNKNGQDGFHATGYAARGSSLIERNILYSYATGTSADKNGDSGIVITDRAVQGSTVAGLNELFGKTTGISSSKNGYDGVLIATGYDDATSRAQQVNYFRGNTISDNAHDGVALIAYGPGAGSVGGGYQFSKFVANTIASNGRYGIYALAEAGATQVIDAFAGMNTLPGNGVAKLHLRNLGATQIIY